MIKEKECNLMKMKFLTKTQMMKLIKKSKKHPRKNKL